MNNHNLAVEKTEKGFKVWTTDSTPDGTKDRVILDGSLIEDYGTITFSPKGTPFDAYQIKTGKTFLVLVDNISNKASEILKGKVPHIQLDIQANYGEHLGYVGEKPIAESSTGFKVAIKERLMTLDNDEAYTEYDGFWVENDLGRTVDEAFALVWASVEPKLKEYYELKKASPYATK